MPRDESTSSYNRAIVDARLASEALPPMLERFAQLRRERARQLAAAEARLKEPLGERHQRVFALSQAAGIADMLESSLRSAVQVSRRQEMRLSGWMVCGQVVGREYRPVPGVCVQVGDWDFSNHDLISTITTNEYGFFATTYDEEAFGDHVTKRPDLYVRVLTSEDEEGGVLNPPVAVLYDAGRIVYFLIKLDKRLPGVSVEDDEEPHQRQWQSWFRLSWRTFRLPRRT
jgi:hypothetical protein